MFGNWEYFQDNGIGPEGILALAAALETNKAIKVLDLAGEWIWIWVSTEFLFLFSVLFGKGET